MDMKIKQVLVSYAKIVMCFGLLLGCNFALAVEYTGGEFRDPFSSLEGQYPEAATAARGTEGYVLQGILWSATAPQAIVNGEVVKVGEVVGGGEVAAIDRRGVKLILNGEERYLSIEKRK